MINKKGNVYNLLRLLWTIFKKMPFTTLITFIIPLLGGLLNVFIYSAQVNIIDIVASNIKSNEWKVILKSVSIPLVIIMCISILQSIATFFEKVSGNKLKENLSLIFQKEIIDIANHVPYVYYDDKDFCNKLQRAKSVVGEDLVNILFNFTSAISIAASLLSIILLSASAGFYSITFITTIMIIVNLSIKLSAEINVKMLNRELTFEGRTGDYLSSALTSTNVIRETRIYNSHNYFFNLWGSNITKQHNQRMNARRTEIKVGMITTTIQTVAIFIVLTMLINNISVSPKVTIGLITTLFLSLIQCGRKILSLTWPLSKLYTSCSKLYDFNEFLNLKKDLRIIKKIISSSTYDDNYLKNANEILSPIVLSNVNFSYKSSKTLILSDINLTINKNEKIAIVGANGAGKSTLIKLILGLYSPNSGSITWDGNNYIHNKISVVFQNYIKFELSLRENIALGNIKEINNNKLILETMKKCNCYDLYEKLGNLDVPLGKIINGGRELSGGEWQKLAIARSIFSDSDLLIFDEPTASIDPSTEAEIFNNIIELCNNKTAIFISHRLGWAKNADRIILINNGRIEETGTHNELISLGGLYSNMYNIQASWYEK